MVNLMNIRIYVRIDLSCHSLRPVLPPEALLLWPDPNGAEPFAPGDAGQRACQRGFRLPGTCNGLVADWPARARGALLAWHTWPGLGRGGDVISHDVEVLCHVVS